MTIQSPLALTPARLARGVFAMTAAQLAALVTPATEAGIGRLLARDARAAGHRGTRWPSDVLLASRAAQAARAKAPAVRLGPDATRAERRAAAVRMRAQGHALETIAASVRVSRNTVRALLAEAGGDGATPDMLADRRAVERAALRRRVADMVAGGMTQGETADAMGI